MKICYRCGKEKDESDFYFDRNGYDGKSHYCKECAKSPDGVLSRTYYYDMAHEMLPLLIEKQKSKCEKCGGKIDINNRRKYVIHHINTDITNNNINNLVLLCASCHIKLHRELKPLMVINSKIRREYGHSMKELASYGLTRLDKIRVWEEIAKTPGAVYKGLGFGVIKKHRYLIEYGHTLQEFADYFGVSRQRVEQLMKKGSPRIKEAKEYLDGVLTGLQ